jgi:endo-1,4-beta-xylanase
MNNSLKDAWSRHFKVGAAVNRAGLEQDEIDKIVKRHFNSITAENAMKLGIIHPKEDFWDWDECDFIADYARRNSMLMRGHTMIWHNQCAQWLFQDGDRAVSKSKLFQRLEEHIFAVTRRYNDIVYSWDVINEAIDTDKGDENGFRLSEWYKIGGKEIFEFAFKKMREASPNAKLFYNDYNNESGKKLETTLRYLSSLLDAGIPIDGVGIQGHWYYNSPDEGVLRNALEKYSSAGLEIEITEMDISIYEWNEAKEKTGFFTSPPGDRAAMQEKRFLEIFKIACEYPAVKNITTWGVADKCTWLDNFPVKDRKNWPLLFDTKCKEKEVVQTLIEAGGKT